MTSQKKGQCPKKSIQKVSFDLKLSIIDQINNGQISLNHASKVYQISRGTIQYWMRKFSALNQKNMSLSKNEEIKKLKDKIEELELVKDIQQLVILDLEKITGKDIAKKLLPKTLHTELEKKKRSLLK